MKKLRAILLMEADFNFHKKLILGKRMVDTAQSEGLIPSEQYAIKESTANDGTFDKVMENEISPQRRLPMCIISADAENCYVRVHHSILALVFAALVVNNGLISAMIW